MHAMFLCALATSCSLYWMKDVTKSDLRKRNPLDRKYLTDDEIDSIHLANISRMCFVDKQRLYPAQFLTHACKCACLSGIL